MNKKTRRRESLSSSKIVRPMLFILIFTLFLPMISGFNFDNSISYSNSDKTFTITNLFGLGDTIGKGDLLTPLKNNKVLIGEDRIVMMYDFYEFEKEEKGLGEVAFIDMNTKKQIEKDYHFEQITYESYTSPNWETTCDEIAKNGSEICEHHITHYSTIERMVRTPYDSKVLEGEITLALVTDVEEGDSIDGKWEIAGKYADRHAVWNATKDVDLINYYRFDESAGDVALNDINGNNNFTIILGSFSDNGILNNMLNYTLAGELNASSDYNATITGNFNRSVNFWSYTNGISDAGTKTLFGWGGTGGREGFYFLIQGGNYKFYDYTSLIDSGLAPRSSWIMHTATTNGTGIKYYVNGSLVGFVSGITSTTTETPMYLGRREEIGADNTYNGTIDELGIWNRTLSDSEILDLYNEGMALLYQGAILITVTLTSPDDNIDTNKFSNYFSSNFLLKYGSGNLTNTTLFVWNPDNSLFGTNRTIITGISNSSNLSLGGLSIANGYQWNYYACGRNSTNGIYCSFGESNRTFDIILFIENSQNYSMQTIEKSTETFLINITYDSSRFTTVYPLLVYNKTSYIGTTTDTGDNRVYSSSISVPTVTIDTNISFYWDFGFYNGITISYSNSTTQNQTVRNLKADNCTTYTNLIYNFTVKDEADRTILVGGTDNVTIDLDLTMSSLGTEDGFLTYSHNYPYTNPAQICLEIPLNTSEYRVDLTGEYESLDYVKEFYYIDNGTITNNTVPQNIDLHDLLLADSTTFLFTFIDTNGLAVEEAIVHVDRKYTGEGVFREVERARTDDSGETHVHLVEEDVTYRFRITKEGVLLYTSPDYQAKCLSTPCEIEIRASESYFDVDEDSWDNMEGGYYTISKDDSARQITLEFYSDPISILNINFTAFSYAEESGRQSVATNTLSATSGTIILTIPNSYGNQTYLYAVYQDNDLVVWGWFSLIQRGIDFFGNTLGVILTAFLVLTLGLMAVTEGVAVIVFLIFGLGLAGILKLLEISWVAFIGVLVAGLILIWKLTTRRRVR